MKSLAPMLLLPVLLSAPISSQADAQSLNSPVPPRATPADLVSAFHAAFGNHHARAVHTKGVLLRGEFTPDTQAAALTSAPHLQGQHSKVLVRFSNFTGIPDIPDNSVAGCPRGIALKFILPEGRSTDIVGHSFNGFPTETADEFRLFLLSVAATNPNSAKPTAVEYFLETHPITKTFLTTQPLTASWAATPFFGVNSFKFTNRRGEAHYIRYQLVPAAGAEYLTMEELTKRDPQFLATDIRARVAAGPIRFHLLAQVAEKADHVGNPAVAWPDARRRVPLGTITITELAAGTPEEDRATQFNPGNLPEGIEMADEMVRLRAASYPISVRERQ